jgi:MFS family permease
MGPSLLGWTQSQLKYRGGEIMSDNAHKLTDRRLTTPRAAAVAGILFALLLSAAYILIRISIPANPADGGAWLEERGNMVALALSLVPIAGIAFLWFIGVIRDRIGKLEDKFFSSVFFGSGLLFLAMTFVAAALAGGLLTSYAIIPTELIDSGLYTFIRTVMYRISNIYAIRMAGVFMISLATISVRTRIMHRGLAFLTYGLALVLLFSIGYSLWVTLIFPAWVLIISVYILVLNLRSKAAAAEGDQAIMVG